MSWHDEETLGAIHIPYNWTYADQATREADTSVVSGDIGKFARQLDDDSLWMLIATTPTWVAVSGGGSAEDATHVVVKVRKGSAGTINKGQPVCVTGWNASGFVEVELADADNAARMPSIGLAEESITSSAPDKDVVAFGTLSALDTSSFSVLDQLYVSATEGELTATRPTGTSQIQKVAEVLRDHASLGVLFVSGANRTNALPNLADGKIWKGDGDAQPQEIDFTHANVGSVGEDDHHNKTHGTAEHSGSIGAHSQITGVGDDDHHSKIHGTAEHSGDVGAASQVSNDSSVSGSKVKEALETLDSAITAVEQGMVRRRAVIDLVDATAVPPTEVTDDRYILDHSGAPHANWDGASQNDIVEFNGSTWDAVSPEEGWVAYVDLQNKDALFVDDGTPQWQLRPIAVTDHADLSNVTTDQHHAKVHGAAEHSGNIGAHSQITSVGDDDHHAKSHAHNGADGSGTVAHSDATGQTVNDHHNRDHASTHGPSAADPLKLDDLEVPDDNTDLDASASKHGLLPKLSNVITEFLNGQGGFSVPAGGGGDDDQMAARYESNAGQSADSTSYVPIQWDTEDFEDSDFTHDTVTNNSRIEVGTTARYLILGSLNYIGTTANYRLTCDVAFSVDGGAKLSNLFSGAYVRVSSGSEAGQVFFGIILSLTAGEYFEIFSRRLSTITGDGTIDSGSNFSIVRLQGAKGEKGDTGSGSSISLEDESSPVTGTPHTTLNFLGNGVAVANVDGDEATITINGMRLAIPATDHSGSGLTELATVDVNAYGAMAALYLAADGNYETADGDVNGKHVCSAIAITSGTGGGKEILKFGLARDDTWNWTPGKPIYVSATVGTLTQTVPVTSPANRTPIGYAVSADVMFFNPPAEQYMVWYAESEGVSTRTVASWATKVSIPSLPVGTYDLKYSFEMEGNDAVGQDAALGQVYNTTASTEYAHGVADHYIVNEYWSCAGRKENVVLSTGNETVVIRYQDFNGYGATSRIRFARLTMTRKGD